MTADLDAALEPPCVTEDDGTFAFEHDSDAVAGTGTATFRRSAGGSNRSKARGGRRLLETTVGGRKDRGAGGKLGKLRAGRAHDRYRWEQVQQSIGNDCSTSATARLVRGSCHATTPTRLLRATF